MCIRLRTSKLLWDNNLLNGSEFDRKRSPGARHKKKDQPGRTGLSYTGVKRDALSVLSRKMSSVCMKLSIKRDRPFKGSRNRARLIGKMAASDHYCPDWLVDAIVLDKYD